MQGDIPVAGVGGVSLGLRVRDQQSPPQTPMLARRPALLRVLAEMAGVCQTPASSLVLCTHHSCPWMAGILHVHRMSPPARLPSLAGVWTLAVGLSTPQGPGSWQTSWRTHSQMLPGKQQEEVSFSKRTR